VELTQKLEIKQKADLDYFNGFRTAVKLINFQSQFLRSALVEIDKDKLKETVQAWEKNVVAIGLSYGFLEPLESTGLLSTHEVIKHLVTVLDRRNGVVGSVDRDSLNTECKGVMTGMSGFVAAHYYCSHRNDTPYWKHLTEEKEYEVSDFFLQGGWKTIFTGLPYIAFGAQVLPLGYDKEDMKKIANGFFTYKKGICDAFMKVLEEKRYKC